MSLVFPTNPTQSRCRYCYVATVLIQTISIAFRVDRLYLLTHIFGGAQHGPFPAHVHGGCRSHSCPPGALRDSNGELRLWNLGSCRTEYQARLHNSNAGLLHLYCAPAYGTLISQGRDGCVRLWAAGQTGAIDRSQSMFEIRTESFNFCRCAVWAPGSQEGTQAGGSVAAGPQPQHVGRLRVACAAHDPADVAVWRPVESPSSVIHLRQSPSETKHGMCMSLAFLPAAVPASAPSGPLTRPTTNSPLVATSQDPPPAAQLHISSHTSQHTRHSGQATLSDATLSNSHADGETGITVSTPGNVSSGSCSSSGADDVADPRYIVAGYEDGAMALWDLRNPSRPLGSVRVHGEPVMCLDVRARVVPPTRGGVGGGGAAGEGGAADSDGGILQAAVSALHDDNTAASTATASLTYDFVSGSADDQIGCGVLRPAESQSIALAAKQPPKLRTAGTADVHIRPDSKLFACGCWDGRVRLYSLRRREPLAVLKYHAGQVTAVAFSPQTHTLASASRDTTIALWAVYTNTGHQQQ